jgi:hypothetical protein
VGVDVVGNTEGLSLGLGVEVVIVEFAGNVLGLEAIGDSLGLTDGLNVGVSVGVDVDVVGDIYRWTCRGTITWSDGSHSYSHPPRLTLNTDTQIKCFSIQHLLLLPYCCWKSYE